MKLFYDVRVDYFPAECHLAGNKKAGHNMKYSPAKQKVVTAVISLLKVPNNGNSPSDSFFRFRLVQACHLSGGNNLSLFENTVKLLLQLAIGLTYGNPGQ